MYVQLTVPRFLGLPLRLEIRPHYSWETTLGYYGMGNASSAVAPPGAPATYFEYGRLHPEISIALRWRVVDHVGGRAGALYTQNWIQVADNSKLADDLKNGSAETKGLLGSTAAHGVGLVTAGIQWDNRDNEVSSHSGSFDTIDVKFSPGGTKETPYRYGQATAIERAFIPIWNPRIVLAGQLVGDVLVGSPPFYELSRFDDTYAIGGMSGVRGVPGQRYYGKVKVLGNVELRTELVSFHALGKPLLFGAVAFFDGGRVWADTSSQPALDGTFNRTGVGLKYGVGGGLRLQSGSASCCVVTLLGRPTQRRSARTLRQGKCSSESERRRRWLLESSARALLRFAGRRRRVASFGNGRRARPADASLQRGLVEVLAALGASERDLRALALTDVVVWPGVRTEAADELTDHRRRKEAFRVDVRVLNSKRHFRGQIAGTCDTTVRIGLHPHQRRSGSYHRASPPEILLQLIQEAFVTLLRSETGKQHHDCKCSANGTRRRAYAPAGRYHGRPRATRSWP